MRKREKKNMFPPFMTPHVYTLIILSIISIGYTKYSFEVERIANLQQEIFHLQEEQKFLAMQLSQQSNHIIGMTDKSMITNSTFYTTVGLVVLVVCVGGLIYFFTNDESASSILLQNVSKLAEAQSKLTTETVEKAVTPLGDKLHHIDLNIAKVAEQIDNLTMKQSASSAIIESLVVGSNAPANRTSEAFVELLQNGGGFV